MGNEQSHNIEVAENGTIGEKHENGSVNGLSTNITSNGLDVDVKSNVIVHPDDGPQSPTLVIESSNNGKVELEVPSVISEIITKEEEEEEEVATAKEGKAHLFGKLFKKKAARAVDKDKVLEREKETSGEDQVDVGQLPTEPQQETSHLKQDSESPPEAQTGTPDSSPEEEPAPDAEDGNQSQEERNPEDNPVMNFFKTLVTTTKTSKKETAAPDASKDQAAQISEPPAAPKGMPVPPPPPPEPPKMEVKGEATAKPVKPVSKEEPKAAGKQTEPSKGKSAKDTLNRFFRQKETPVEGPDPVIEVKIENKAEPQQAAVEVQQIVEVQKVDPSKAGTLEATAKPEPPPPVQEEKKLSSKSSFLSLFKPKVLLDHMTTKVQAASTSGVQLFKKTTGLAAEPKKTTAPPAAEAAHAAKAKEEPKAAAAKSADAAAENKPASVASQAGEDAPHVPKRLEKRNSIHLFFKNLSQKRHSTDAGVQTEAAAAPAADKTK
ncbi:breast carcinoma-amplified sequence 1 isoform X3 [Cololabis saira]|uniref:breast carcinoma-amplified sequence 1 isoform X3 n=1 Tax=Cololabis saira TaxID=129043 RepID=UPI002AD2F88A|nr:breast carcinoma-amplified sequence 1 isoform X3 [Cololabis saira]